MFQAISPTRNVQCFCACVSCKGYDVSPLQVNNRGIPGLLLFEIPWPLTPVCLHDQTSLSHRVWGSFALDHQTHHQCWASARMISALFQRVSAVHVFLFLLVACDRECPERLEVATAPARARKKEVSGESSGSAVGAAGLGTLIGASFVGGFVARAAA